jgi:hypothetical protein
VKDGSDPERAADLSMETALGGDFTLLIGRLVSGQQLRQDEREFLGRLLYHLQNPKRGRTIPDEQMHSIALNYALLAELDPNRQDKDIVAELCDAHGITGGTVYNARRRHKINPEIMRGIIELVGGREQARRRLQRWSAFFRKLGV